LTFLQAFADQLAQIMHSPRFRTYTTNDIISVQVGGAVKNVLAIAAAKGLMLSSVCLNTWLGTEINSMSLNWAACFKLSVT
jgi:glycerol-3-phosphate dehydrogenase